MPFVLTAYPHVWTWSFNYKGGMTMSLTANELFRQYMAMSYEDRQQFLTMFRSTYETNKMLEKLKHEEESND